MDLSNPQVDLILGAGLLLIYFCIVAVMMVYASPALHYHRQKDQAEGLMLRFVIIPFTLPFRIVISVLLGLVKLAKWLLFFVVGIIALVFTPLYLLIYRPLKNYFYSFNEPFANFDKFIVFFRSGIRLGDWLMFYKSEPISSQRVRNKTSHSITHASPAHDLVRKPTINDNH